MKNANCSSLAQSRPDFLLPFLRFGEKGRNYFTRNVSFSERSEYKIKLSIIIMLLLAPFFALAQEECPESTPPKFDSEHEPRTLCQKYSPPGEFPNHFGTDDTHFASQIIANLNNGSEVFTGDIDLVGDLIIDQDFTLLNCKVRISPNVKIKVITDVSFILDGSKLFCCKDMWQGIDADYGSSIITQNITEIEDASVAIESPCRSSLSIMNTTFNRNFIGIRLGYDGATPQSPCPGFSSFSQFSGNTFQCNAPLNGTINNVSFAGIQVYKVSAIIGSDNSEINTFRNTQYGIRFESQWAGVSMVSRCRFIGSLNDGIFLYQGRLKVNHCYFTNNGLNGINAVTTRGLDVFNSNFICNDDVAIQTDGDGVNIYKHIRAAQFDIGSIIRISNNTFSGNFSDTEKNEQLNCIELLGGLDMGAGTEIRIEFNSFSIIDASSSFGQSSAILLRSDFPVSTITVVQFNSFFLDHPLQEFNNSQLYGIRLINGDKFNTSIFNNVFDSNAWGPQANAADDFGINVEGSMGSRNEISANRFVHNSSTAFSINYTSGISISDFLSTKVCNNEIRECANGVTFVGMNTGTNYVNNSITGGGTCFQVLDGAIGAQGAQGALHNGNKWYDKWNNVISTYQAILYPENLVEFSLFRVHTPQSVLNTFPISGYSYFSEFHPALIVPDQSDEWFKEDATGVPSNEGCVNYVEYTTKTDESIALDFNSSEALSPSQKWMARRYLYTKLMKNPSLRADYESFENFLEYESTTSVGQLYAVSEKIAEGASLSLDLKVKLNQLYTNETLALQKISLADSILSTSVDTNVLTLAQTEKEQMLHILSQSDSIFSEVNVSYQSILSESLHESLALNSEVEAITDYENHEKNINDISIRKILFQNGELTELQKQTLRIIAEKCPKYDGHGVYRARGLLTGCNADNWSNNDTDCYFIAPPVQEQILENGFAERFINNRQAPQGFTWPNPAAEGFYIRTLSKQSGKIFLQDLTGKTYKDILFSPLDESIYLGLESVPSGVYTCTVKGDNGEQLVSKILVIKP